MKVRKASENKQPSGFWAFVLATALAACTPEREANNYASEIKLDVPHIRVERVDSQMMRLQTKPEIMAFLNANPSLKTAFLQPEPEMPDSVLASRMLQTLTNPAYQKFYGEVQKTFGDMKDVETQLETAFKNTKYFYPGFKVPKIQAVVSGLGFLSREGAALSVSDSLIVISLDFYVGPKGSFVPNVPAFLLKKYTKPALVPSIVGVMAEKHIAQNPADKSMLNEMIVAAKKLEFTRQIMPDVPDSLISFYSGAQQKDSEQNKDVIWAHFVKEKLLYETNHFVKVKYIGERPFTAEIGQKCPGAIGRWLGWQIVRKYLDENPDVKLPQLMQNPDAQDVFVKSKYKGN